MTILEITEKLKNGSREEIKEAQKALKKIDSKENKKAIERFLLDGIRDFESIKKIPNKVAFLRALSWPIFSFGKKHYELCRNFILKSLQNSDGRIRQQARLTGDYLAMTCDFWEPWGKKMTHKQSENKQRCEEMIFG